MRTQDTRKQAVSLRLRVGDIRKVKRLADRLGVSDSDVIRYALNAALGKLAPLCDPGTRGQALVPVFIDSGLEMLQHFAFDKDRLEEIINGDAPPDKRVAEEDLQLMALIGMQRGYAKLSLRQLQAEADIKLPGEHALDDTLSSSFRRHLYAKYVRGTEHDKKSGE